MQYLIITCLTHKDKIKNMKKVFAKLSLRAKLCENTPHNLKMVILTLHYMLHNLETQ